MDNRLTGTFFAPVCVEDYDRRMPRPVFAHFLPTLFEPADLAGGIAVVIDVLRASTTICHALEAGATAVIPCEEVQQARATAEELASQSPLLGGERDGKLIPGFHLDNSPLRYTPDTVVGKPVVFTTTNGTRALMRSQRAERIVLGAFVNLSAVVRDVSRFEGPVHLVCAGTRGQITAEDVLCAGAIAHRLSVSDPTSNIVADDQARMAAEFYGSNRERLPAALAESLGGRNCRALGFDADVARAAEVDRVDCVPVFRPGTGRIEG